MPEHDVKGHVRRSALKLAGYVVVVVLVLRLIPTLNQALTSLKRVSWGWVAGAMVLEVLSETGFVVSWRRIVDPDRVLQRDGRGWRMGQRVAWAQLGGGLVVPGGSKWDGRRRLDPSPLRDADRADRRASVQPQLPQHRSGRARGLLRPGAGDGDLPGEDRLLLSLMPAAVSGCGIAAALFIAPRASTFGTRLQAKHAKIARSIFTLADAVNDTKRVLSHRGGSVTVLGAVAYLGFDLLILWLASRAVHAHPTPGFAIVVMAYIIGALGGSLPLPASIGTIAGIAGMLIVYGVHHNPAVAAVLLYQAIGLLVPIVGGTTAYLIIRRQLGPVPVGAHHGSG